jgi:hypothetical protein
MRAFLVACLAAIVVAVVAYAVLGYSDYLKDAASSVFSRPNSVRI